MSRSSTSSAAEEGTARVSGLLAVRPVEAGQELLELQADLLALGNGWSSASRLRRLPRRG